MGQIQKVIPTYGANVEYGAHFMGSHRGQKKKSLRVLIRFDYQNQDPPKHMHTPPLQVRITNADFLKFKLLQLIQ